MKKTVNILIFHVLALMVTLTITTGCENNRSRSSEEKISSRENARIEVYIDKELGISCFLSTRTDKGIDCIKKVINSTDFVVSRISRIERYLDKKSKTVCYQSTRTDMGVSCLDVSDIAHLP